MAEREIFWIVGDDDDRLLACHAELFGQHGTRWRYDPSSGWLTWGRNYTADEKYAVQDHLRHRYGDLPWLPEMEA